MNRKREETLLVDIVMLNYLLLNINRVLYLPLLFNDEAVYLFAIGGHYDGFC